jgi:hypothetical protein
MEDKFYRVRLQIEEVDPREDYEKRLVEQVDMGAFHTLEQALNYRNELSQHPSDFAGETEAIPEESQGLRDGPIPLGKD